jgi:hypothetical protein
LSIEAVNSVFCPETQAVYDIPIEDVSTRQEARLRVTAAANNQVQGIRLATAYEIAKIDVY